MPTPPTYSIIVPVYNRPHEINELLQSLAQQHIKDFEVIIIDDGSSEPCQAVCENYQDRLDIGYFFKPNSGPGITRNFGMDRAQGKYFIILDSDCMVPPAYLSSIEKYLCNHPDTDAWGGPDRAHENFSTLQRAMAFTMSSFLVTGGIRGAKRTLGDYQPRSFNMGMRREVYYATQGFDDLRVSEDILLSIKIKKSGHKTAYISDAFVYHKRRLNWRLFFRQVQSFGKGRASLLRFHSDAVRWVHWLPTFFLIALICWGATWAIAPGLAQWGALALALWFSALIAEALVSTRSMAIALLSVPVALVQLCGYGFGFLAQRLKQITGFNLIK